MHSASEDSLRDARAPPLQVTHDPVVRSLEQRLFYKCACSDVAAVASLCSQQAILVSVLSCCQQLLMRGVAHPGLHITHSQEALGFQLSAAAMAAIAELSIQQAISSSTWRASWHAHLCILAASLPS